MKGIILAGGVWYTSVSFNKGDQQAAPSDLRQTDDLLSNVGFNECRYSRYSDYLYTAGYTAI